MRFFRHKRSSRTSTTRISATKTLMALPPILHLNGPEYGISQVTAAMSTFSNARPGRYGVDYHYDSLESLQFLADRGWRYVKIPIRWERIQPDLGGDLDPAELDRLTEFVEGCAEAGLSVIIDVHNYGLYFQDVSGTGVRCALGDPELPLSVFADLWSRLAGWFRAHPAVVGYAIMAEPQPQGGLTVATWQEASQLAVEAIRAAGSAQEIHVAGFNFSTVRDWAQVNGPRAWIDDPTGGVIRYEGHHYWDEDQSGAYRLSYVEEARALTAPGTAPHPILLRTRTVEELTRFADWLDANQVAGLIGECGWPGSQDSAEWELLARWYLRAAQSVGLPVTAWFAGEWADTNDDLRLYERGTPLSTPRAQSMVWEQLLRTGDVEP